MIDTTTTTTLAALLEAQYARRRLAAALLAEIDIIELGHRRAHLASQIDRSIDHATRGLCTAEVAQAEVAEIVDELEDLAEILRVRTEQRAAYDPLTSIREAAGQLAADLTELALA